MPENQQEQVKKAIIPTEKEKQQGGEEKVEIRKTRETVEQDARKKTADTSSRAENSKTKLKEKRQQEQEKKDFLKNTYAYELNANNPPEKGSEDEHMEEYYLGDERKETEKTEKEVQSALKEKYEAEIEETIKTLDLDKTDSSTKKAIYTHTLRNEIKLENIKIKGSDGKDVDTSKLPPEEQEVLKLKKIKEYTEAIARIPDEIKKSPEKFQAEKERLAKENLGLTKFDDQEKLILSEEAFIEEASKNPEVLNDFISSIKKEGMAFNLLDPKSQLGQKITKIIDGDVRAYLEIFKPKDGLVDIDNFKGLKDVLGDGGYRDLLFGEEFLLGKDHALNKARETIIKTIADAAAQHKVDSTTPEGLQNYQKAIEKEFSDATGLDGKKEMQNIARVSRFANEHPFVKFIANLLAPIGAMFGGEVGEFWRSYIEENQLVSKQKQNAYGPGQAQPIEGKGVENASASAIYEAAKSELGKSESSTPDAIREMHKYGGLNAGPNTAWCMSFVQYVLRKKMGFNSDQIGKPTAWAADGHSIGRHTDTPKAGDIVLVHSSEANSGKHIGFVDSINTDGSVNVLGGNQSNSVCVKKFPKSSIAEFRTLEISTATSQNTDKGNDSIKEVGPGYNGKIGPDNKIDVTPEKLNASLGGKLAGTGETFVEMGKKYGVQPRLLAAISMQETGNGTSRMINEKNNVAGLYDGKRKTYRTFPSIQHSIEFLANQIANSSYYFRDGRYTVAKIQPVYAPVGASNDPKKLNGDWAGGVNKFLQKIG